MNSKLFLSISLVVGILLANSCGGSPKNPVQNPTQNPTPSSTSVETPSGETGRGVMLTADATNRELEYFYYIPTSVATSKKYQILLCVPGLNGSGAVFIQREWMEFANKNGLVIVSPSFRFNQKDWENKRSYQFPEVWSGNAIMKIVDEVNRKIGSKDRGLYLFGHSAGAQVAHRFALFKPERCVAVAAHAPGGCTHPSRYIPVRFLMTVGEDDHDRRWKTKEFSQRCQELGISIVYKEYPGVGHGLTREQLELSKGFFEEIISKRLNR